MVMPFDETSCSASASISDTSTDGKEASAGDEMMRVSEREWLRFLGGVSSVSFLVDDSGKESEGDSIGDTDVPPSFEELSSCIAKPERAAIRSSASVSVFGGSSRICSHPTGGDPGGLIRKFLSVTGTGRREELASEFCLVLASMLSGVDGPKYTRSSVLNHSMSFQSLIEIHKTQRREHTSGCARANPLGCHRRPL